MNVAGRIATSHDIALLTDLYRALESEQIVLRPLWDLAEGLPEPIADAFARHLEDERSLVVIGELDDVPLGFCVATVDDLLPQAKGERVATIRWIFTDPAARGVGIGHEMVSQAIDHFADMGISYFDAVVSPGHRNAKNFFEAHGFSARSIVMHRGAAE